MMQLDEIRSLIKDDRQAADALIQRRLQSDVMLVNQLSHYIIDSGGKRLRPILLLLVARAFGYKGPHHIALAAIIEFIHTATLLHDDVVDGSVLRRGMETANARWGDQASVLVGDFLYSRSFEMMVEVGNLRIMEILAHATNIIAEGEVLQLLNCHDPETTETRYMATIYRKTAKLFEAAAQIGTVLSGCGAEQEQAMARFGMHIGTAFQLIDDVLDYSASSEEMGKNVGDDLAEGKPTLPLIYALLHGNREQGAIIRRAIEEGGRDDIVAVTRTIESTGALAYTAQVARCEADKALRELHRVPASPYRDGLEALVEFSVNRNY